MGIGIREWRIEDKAALAQGLNNRNVLDNLRDGIPYPYTEQDAEDFIRAMLAADKDAMFAFAITLDGEAIGSISVESLVIMARLKAARATALLRHIRSRAERTLQRLYSPYGGVEKSHDCRCPDKQNALLVPLARDQAGNPTKALCNAKAFALILWMSPRHFAAR